MTSRQRSTTLKIAFVGKGGSGKTTLSALFARQLAADGAEVVAVDADINQHLGVALGLSEREAAAVPALGARLPQAKEFLRGENPRIASGADMVKTTPAGHGSRLLRVGGGDPFHGEWSLDPVPGAGDRVPPAQRPRLGRQGHRHRPVRAGRPRIRARPARAGGRVRMMHRLDRMH
jgi:hypothetical protein